MKNNLTYANPKIYPLTSVQHGIWQAQKIDPDNPQFNIAQFTEINGTVNPVLFEKALRHVVIEAETLRLQFTENAKNIQQQVGLPGWSMPVIDFSAEVNPQASAMAWMKTECQQPFNLLRGPLFFYALIKVAANKFFWYYRYHHIVIDGFGCTLVVERVAQVYSMLAQGVEIDACPFGPISKLLESDFAYRISSQYKEDEAYWVKYCKNFTEPVSFTSSRAPASKHYLNKTAYVDRPDIKGLPARDLVILITAVVATYLYQFTHSQDIILGLVFKSRFGEDRSIPGLACNNLPLHLTVQPDMRLSALRDQTVKTIQKILAHQRYRVQDLRRALELPKNQRLYGPSINFMPLDSGPYFDGHSSRTYAIATGQPDDIWITLYNQSQQFPLQIDISANPAVYTMDDLAMHHNQLVRLMHAFVDTPHRLVGSIS
ncbi:condensation domain-containing protein [Mycetohabitans rhizoxinica]|uniref:condensation domain-containing protein n=1 Tax=Mycetohabitans rhizoxinica TaxID=412963 RepID=UPI0030CAF141